MNQEETKKLEELALKYTKTQLLKLNQNPAFKIEYLIKNAFKAGYRKKTKLI